MAMQRVTDPETGLEWLVQEVKACSPQEAVLKGYVEVFDAMIEDFMAIGSFTEPDTTWDQQLRTTFETIGSTTKTVRCSSVIKWIPATILAEVITTGEGVGVKFLYES